jgi:CBS-domain-containing membrane protein
MEIVKTLQNLTISAFSGESRSSLVRVDPTASVGDALKTFNTEKVLSCPIANTNGADVWGFLDLFDLLSYLLQLWDDNEHAETNGIAKLGEKFLNHKVQDLTGRSDNDAYAAVIAEEHAHRLVRLFGLGVHRVAQLDLHGTMTNVISQSDVVKYLHAHINLFGEQANKPINELNMIATDKLVVAQADQSAISAFKLISDNLVSAVPIVDKDGTLAGTLSVSDLRLIQDDLSPLLLSVLQYKSIQEPRPAIVCASTTTLGSVVATLANSNVHRVWVTDDRQRPVSVISITNVCEFLSQFFVEEDE